MRRKIKTILLTLTVIVIIWVGMIVTDYVRYKNNEKPMFITLITHYDYVDGYINEYSGLGYKYYEYRRDAIKGDAFVPFWEGRKGK